MILKPWKKPPPYVPKILKSGNCNWIFSLNFIYILDFESYNQRQHKLNSSYNFKKEWEIKTGIFLKRRGKLKDEIGTKINMDKVMSSIIEKNLDKRSKNMPMDKLTFYY